MSIIPIHPDAAAQPAADAEPTERTVDARRTLWRRPPSRRTMGRKVPSLRTLGYRNPSRRTLAKKSPSRRTFGHEAPLRAGPWAAHASADPPHTSRERWRARCSVPATARAPSSRLDVAQCHRPDTTRVAGLTVGTTGVCAT